MGGIRSCDTLAAEVVRDASSRDSARSTRGETPRELPATRRRRYVPAVPTESSDLVREQRVPLSRFLRRLLGLRRFLADEHAVLADELALTGHGLSDDHRRSDHGHAGTPCPTERSADRVPSRVR